MDFKEIYNTYSPKIFRVCLGYTNDYEQAKDLTQETFYTAFKNLSTFKGESHISTWIFRIATNFCLRAMERSKRITHTELNMETPSLQDETIEEKVSLLYRCISSLEETERIIISLVLEDVPQSEIAEITGLSHANIRVRIHRIKEKLANKVKLYGQFE